MKPSREIRPRGLRREEAASYVGVSPSKFDQLVQRGDMPKGFSVDGCRIWDVNDLDVYFTLLKGENAEVRQWAKM